MLGQTSIVKPIITVYEGITEEGASFLAKLQKEGLDVTKNELLPHGHIFVHSPSIRGRNSTWKVSGNYIDFEKRIHVEIMTSIRRGFDFQNR